MYNLPDIVPMVIAFTSNICKLYIIATNMFVYNMIACLHRSSMPSVVQLPNTTKIVMINAATTSWTYLVSSIQAIEFSTLYNTILHEKMVSKKLITTHFKMVGNVLSHELNYFVKHEIKRQKGATKKM
jgi:hypothetical protein